MKAVLIQLPIPKINFGLNTANIPLAPACLKQAAADLPAWEVEILDPDLTSHAGDQSLVDAVAGLNPDLVGFTVFAWNRDRAVYLAQKIKLATGARIVFGGPEITAETLDSLPAHIDVCVIGEGERVFRELLASPNAFWEKTVQDLSGESLLALGSPYVSGHLTLSHDRVMLIETQRGCPFRCGFCYYSKARKKRDIAPDRMVLEALAWGLAHGANEIYLMDPSLNARPGLEGLLREMAALNRSARIPLTSEIRAESVTPEMAALYAEAGFTAFEVGLQSINPAALDLMNRPTRLDRFLAGVNGLKQAGILPTIDLIFGLPGDTPQGFRQTVDFIRDNGLDAHVQVFPLLVLPGTAFRATAKDLGLVHSAHPPYPVLRTRDFSEADMEHALDYAEETFDRGFFPYPDLDLSCQNLSGKDHFISMDGRPHLAKLMLDSIRPDLEIRALALRVCSPLQVFVLPGAADPEYLGRVLGIITGINPFLPMELIFLAPGTLPDTDRLLGAARTARPHFLDLDQRWLYPEPGNRSVLFTLVSDLTQTVFYGPMQRQVFLWQQHRLPEIPDLDALAHLDGILVNTPAAPEHLHAWQDRMAPQYEDLIPITFSDRALQLRWLSLTEGEKYHLALLAAP